MFPSSPVASVADVSAIDSVSVSPSDSTARLATPPPPTSPSRSSSSSSSSAGSSPLLLPVSHKPRPLQLESDDGGASFASEAASPLYYVPQHLLFTPHTSHQPTATAPSAQPFFSQPAFAYAASAYSPSPSPIHLGAYPRTSPYTFSSHLPLTPTSGHHTHAIDNSSLYGSSQPQHTQHAQHLYMTGMVPSPNHTLSSPAFTFSPLPAFTSSPLPLSPLSELTALTFASIPSPSHGQSHSGGMAALGADGSPAYFHSPTSSSFPFPSAAHHQAFTGAYLSRDHSAHSVSSGSPTSVHSAPSSVFHTGGALLDGSGRLSSASSSTSHHTRSFGSSNETMSNLTHSAHSHPAAFGSSPTLLSTFSQLSLAPSHTAMSTAGVHSMIDSPYALYPHFGSSMPAMSATHSIPGQHNLLHSAARLTTTSHTSRTQQQQQQQQQHQQQQQYQYQPQPQPPCHGQQHHQSQPYAHYPQQQQQQQQYRGGNSARSRPVAGPFAQSAAQSSSASAAHLTAPVHFQSATRRGINGNQTQHAQHTVTVAAERGRATNGYSAVHTTNTNSSTKSPPPVFSSLSAPQATLAPNHAGLSNAALQYPTTDGQNGQFNWTASGAGGQSLSPSPPPPATTSSTPTAAAPPQVAVPPPSSHSLPVPLPSSVPSSSGRVSPSPPSVLTVESLVGHVVRLCKTHTGSRFVQQKLEQRDTAFFTVLFNEMTASIVETGMRQLRVSGPTAHQSSRHALRVNSPTGPPLSACLSVSHFAVGASALRLQCGSSEHSFVVHRAVFQCGRRAEAWWEPHNTVRQNCAAPFPPSRSSLSPLTPYCCLLLVRLAVASLLCVCVCVSGSFACQALVDALSTDAQISELTSAITLVDRSHMTAEQLDRAHDVMRQAGVSLIAVDVGCSFCDWFSSIST